MSTHQEQFRKFAAYNAWFNRRLYELAATLGDAERKHDMGAFFGSIHGTFNHLLLIDRLWLGRVSLSPTRFASLESASLVFDYESHGQILYEDFETLRSERVSTDAVLKEWVEELTPDVLASELSYTNMQGETRSLPLWLLAAHLFNHQTHHRGQATTLFSQLGHDPGLTDFAITAFVDDLG